MKTIRKRLIILAISLVSVIAVLLLSAIFWIQKDRQENERIANESIVIKDDLEVAANEKKHISDFLEKVEGEIINDYEFSVDHPGQVEVYFEYNDINDRKRVSHFTINVVDKTAPKIYGNSYYVLPIGYAGDLTNLMLSGDDFDDTPERKIVGEYNLGRAGRYDLQYVITDKSGNSTTQNFILEVIEPSESEGYEQPATNSINLNEIIAQYKTEKTKIGIDVSSWQGEVDWQKVRDSGVEFAMIRTGYQVGYGGEYVVDKYFERNITEATKVGLPIGVYFYSYADSSEQAVRQAEWVVELLQGREAELGIVFDWEDWSSFNELEMSFYTINKIAKDFLKTASEAGYRGVLYGSKNYLDRIWQPENWQVWLAQYYDYPTYEGDFSIWQMTDSGRVNGIDGNVDVNILYIE